MVLAMGHLLAAAEEETSNPILPNATFIAEVFAFAILLWIFNKYALPPLKRAMTHTLSLPAASWKNCMRASSLSLVLVLVPNTVMSCANAFMRHHPPWW